MADMGAASFDADGGLKVHQTNSSGGGGGGGAAGYVALTSPPANTNANADTTLTFSQQVNHFGVQNNTSVNAYVHYESSASLASLVLVPGGYLREEKQLTVLHVFTVTAQPINAQSGLIVEGWM